MRCEYERSKMLAVRSATSAHRYLKYDVGRMALTTVVLTNGTTLILDDKYEEGRGRGKEEKKKGRLRNQKVRIQKITKIKKQGDNKRQGNDERRIACQTIANDRDRDVKSLDNKYKKIKSKNRIRESIKKRERFHIQKNNKTKQN